MLYQTPGASLDLGWTVTGPLLLMIVLFALSVPVWVALGITSVALLLATDVLPMSLFGQALFDGVDAFALIAIPLYILTGDALVRSGLSNKLIDIAEATLGSLRSGLGTSTVLGCGFFSCISGSDAAGAAAVRPDHVQAAGAARLPADLCLRPGRLRLLHRHPDPALDLLHHHWVGARHLGLDVVRRRGGARDHDHALDHAHEYRAQSHPRLREYRRAFLLPPLGESVWDGRFALAIPMIIWGGIYSGVFTPTEAAAAAVVITMTIGFWRGTLTLADIPEDAEVFGQGERCDRADHRLRAAAGAGLLRAQSAAGRAAGHHRVHQRSDVIILMMLAVLILAGCVMETTPNIVILAPIMLPIAQDIGMDPIHFCIFMVTALGVGFITPPLGLDLFVLSGLTGEKILPIAGKAVPYVLSMLVVVLMLGFIPCCRCGLCASTLESQGMTIEYLKRASKTAATGEADVRATVAAMLAEIEAGGEAKAADYAQRLDKWDGDIVVSKDVRAQAAAKVPAKLKDDIRFAHDKVRSFALAQRNAIKDVEIELMPGLIAGHKNIPVATAGCYVPGGRYAHVASAIMSVTTAKVAGVENVIACSPPKPGVGIDPAVLYALDLCGADSVLNLGGVQGVAALAFGLFSGHAADILVGPGNQFVAEASASSMAASASTCSPVPSEILVIADATADPEIVAADLVGQAEHGFNSPAWLIAL